MRSDFQQCSILTSLDWDEPVQSPFKLTFPETPNAVRSIAEHSKNFHMTSKGSDQTAPLLVA